MCSDNYSELNYCCINLATYGGRAFAYGSLQLQTRFLSISETLIFHYQLTNATLRPSSSLPTSTLSAFEVIYKNVLHKFTVIVIIIKMFKMTKSLCHQCTNTHLIPTTYTQQPFQVQLGYTNTLCLLTEVMPKVKYI